MPTSLELESWYCHHELILRLLSSTARRMLQASLPATSAPFAQRITNIEFDTALASYLRVTTVEALATSWLHGSLEVGQLTWIEQALYFKGVGKALKDAEAGGHGRVSFSGTLDTDATLRISGSLNFQRITSTTALDFLSGKRRVYLLGYAEEVRADEVQIRPIFIGNRLAVPEDASSAAGMRESLQVYPGNVDQFSGVDFGLKLNRADLNALRDVSENDFKLWMADILGEPTVPDDWGGEQFDLWTERITIGGRRHSAAIMLKGPAKFHPMDIADLGKRGDQIDRLAGTAAELLVVQHCHEIKSRVVNMLRAYALASDRPRKYMLIDGYDTLRMLRATGRL